MTGNGAPLDAILVADQDEGPPPETLYEYWNVALQEAEITDYDFYLSPHLGIVSLGTWLKRDGFAVAVHDNVFWNASAQESLLAAMDRQPLVVGISTTSFMRAESIFKIAGWARERCPRALVVLGGVTAESRADIRAAGDVTVMGAGEKTLSELTSLLKQGRDWRGLGNLIYKQDDKEVRTRVSPNFDLKELPDPDWGLVRPRLSACYCIEASKGCRYVCAFCGDRDLGNQQMRSVESLVREMRNGCERYGVTFFRFVDSNLTSWPEHTLELCRALIKENLPVEWSCYSRIDNLQKLPELCEAMHEAGCRWIFCGLESGSDAILRGMRKAYGRETIKRGMRLVHEAGLRLHGNFIVGFPGETRETVDETLDMIERTAPNTVNFDALGVVEGSELFAHPERYGIKMNGKDWVHATMDLAQAREELRRCLDTVIHRMENIYIGHEPLVSYGLRGCGLSEDETIDYLANFRDYHRAIRRSDDAARLKSVAGIRRLGTKRQQFISDYTRRTA